MIAEAPLKNVTVPPSTVVPELVVSVTVAVRVTVPGVQDPEKPEGQISTVLALGERLVVVKSADDGGVKVIDRVQPLMDTASQGVSKQSGFSSEMYNVQVPTGSEVLL